jgi:hypothetical protein
VKRLFLAVAAAALAIGLMQTAHGFAFAQSTPQATPTPVLPPAVLPSAQPGTVTVPIAKPKATATPAPPKDTDEKRVGISGVWEVQIQTQTDGTQYTHFKLTQNGSALIGQYLDKDGKKYPLTGSLDGKDVHVVVTMSNGSALVFAGTVEANTDMAGTLNTAKDIVGFTAAYRPKYKWIDNLSPNPGIPGQP